MLGGRSRRQKEVKIEPNVMLECVPKFCYLGDTLGAGGRDGQGTVRHKYSPDKQKCIYSTDIKLLWRQDCDEQH